jgi:hypothetical protein
VVKNIIIAITCGIFSYAIIQLFVFVFMNLFLPWYQSVRYNGLDISGEWTTEETYLESGYKYETTIIINQKANKITGESISNIRKEKKHLKMKTFKINGVFYNGFLIMTAINKNPKRMGFASYLLQVKSGGSKLIGKTIWYDVWNEKILTNLGEDTVFKRK